MASTKLSSYVMDGDLLLNSLIRTNVSTRLVPITDMISGCGWNKMVNNDSKGVDGVS